jgi:hypothetical protein
MFPAIGCGYPGMISKLDQYKQHDRVHLRRRLAPCLARGTAPISGELGGEITAGTLEPSMSVIGPEAKFRRYDGTSEVGSRPDLVGTGPNRRD